MTSQWELCVVGESNLVGPDGAPSNLSAKSKRFAVLVFLALPTPGRHVRRDVLLATFWPELDSARARNALRVTLHQLRQAIGPDAIRGSGEEELWLDSSSIHVDFADLTRALDGGDVSPWLAHPSLELLPGLHVPDAPGFEEWLDAQRHSLDARIVRSALALAEGAERAGDFPQAVLAARAATRIARADEVAVRRLISLLDRSGDRSGALAEFESFQRWLLDQFEATPSPETVALVKRVRERTLAAAPTAASAATARSKPAVDTVQGGAADVRAAPTPAAHHVHPTQGPLLARWLPLGAAFAAVIVLVAGAAVARSRSGRAPDDADSTPIAIVPFRNDIADSTVAYFAPALGESVADGLPSSVVLPYTASRAARAADSANAEQRLRAFGARTIVSGTLSGDRDSLALALTITGHDGRLLFTRSWLHGSERRLVFLRDSVVAAILRTARVPPRQLPPRHVPVAEAYQLSLNAAWLLSRRSRSEMLRSRDLYTKALEIDPEWEDLWLGLARVDGGLAYRNFIDFRTGMLASEQAADEALQRAPNDGRALIERSLARFQLGDRAGAVADARRAEVFDTTDARMQSLIGTWWQWSGDHLDSALFYTRRAERLAPWDRQIHVNILQIVGCMPDSALTLREAKNVLDIDPHEPEALETLAWTLTRFGRWDEAASVYQQRYAAWVPRDLGRRIGALTGEARFRATVRAIREAMYADQLKHPPPTIPLLETRIALFEDVGMRDSSLAALSSVVDSLDAHHANMMCAPNLRAFRDDPRTRAIVRRRGWVAAEFARAP